MVCRHDHYKMDKVICILRIIISIIDTSVTAFFLYIKNEYIGQMSVNNSIMHIYVWDIMRVGVALSSSLLGCIKESKRTTSY